MSAHGISTVRVPEAAQVMIYTGPRSYTLNGAFLSNQLFSSCEGSMPLITSPREAERIICSQFDTDLMSGAYELRKPRS